VVKKSTQIHDVIRSRHKDYLITALTKILSCHVCKNLN